ERQTLRASSSAAPSRNERDGQFGGPIRSQYSCRPCTPSTLTLRKRQLERYRTAMATTFLARKARFPQREPSIRKYVRAHHHELPGRLVRNEIPARVRRASGG